MNCITCKQPISQNINNIVLDLLVKNDVVVDDIITEKINNLIHTYHTDKNQEFSISIKIAEEIKKFYTHRIDKGTRKQLLDALLTDNHYKKYVKFGQNTDIYIKYIENNIDTVDNVYNIINEIIAKKKRKIVLEKALVKNNITDYNKSKFYIDYVDSGNESITNTIKYIKEELLIQLNKKKRKMKLDDFIFQFIENDTFYFNILKHPDYKKYIDTEHISFDQTTDILLEFISNLEKINEKNPHHAKWSNWKKAADKQINQFNNVNNRIDEMLFSFCDSNKDIRVFASSTNTDRKYIHNRCDQLGLLHKSTTRNGNRILTVSKPNNWTLDGVPKQILGKLYECKMCYEEKAEVFGHWSGQGPYCEECIEADDELQGHKWEPMY